MAALGDRQLRTVAGLLALAGATGQATYLVSWSVLGDRSAGEFDWSAAVSLSYGIAGLVLVGLRPRNVLGWLLLVVGVLIGGSSGLGAYGVLALTEPGLDLPGGLAALWVASWMWFAGSFIPVTVLLVRYPTGAAPSAWWRRVEFAAWGGMGLVTLALMLAREGVDDFVPGLTNPVAAPSAVVTALVVAGFGLLAPVTAVCVLGLGVRLWRARGAERQQMAWLLAVATMALAATFLVPGDDDVVLPTVTYCLVPVAIAVAVVRHGLLGIEIVLRRGLVYAALTAIVLFAYAATSAALSDVVTAGATPSVVAAGLVAAVLTPARDRVQRGVDRLLYGERSDPLRAATRLGEQAALVPGRPLEGVTEAVARSVRAPTVTILDEAGERLAAYGHRNPEDAGEAVRAGAQLPLRYAGRSVGTLEVALRPGQRAWSAADEALLAALAPQVALAVVASRLADELDAARRGAVEAVLSERDAVRRELRDGLASALSGVALGLESAETAAAAGDQRAARGLLDRLDDELRLAVLHVRRLLGALSTAEPAPTRALSADTAAGTDPAGTGRPAGPGLIDDGPLVEPSRGRRGRRAAAGTLTIVVLGMAATGAGVHLAAGWPLRELLAILPLALAFGGLGGLLAVRVPANPVGWVLVLIALSMSVTLLGGAYATLGLEAEGAGRGWPAALAVAWAASWAWMPGLGGMWTLLFLLFPDGPPPGRWRHLVPLASVALVIATAGVALSPGDLEAAPGTPNPLGLPGALGVAAVAAGGWGSGLLVLTGVGALGSLAARWRQGDERTRQQLQALLGVGLLVLVFYLVQPLLPTAASTVGLAVTPLLAVGGIAVAVLQHRLYDLDRLVGRTVLFAALTALVLVAYLAAEAVTGPPLPADDTAVLPSLAAAGLVAAVFDPVRSMLQRGGDRLLGGQPEALAAVVDLGDRVGLTDAEDLLPAVASSVAQALRCPLVVVESADGRLLASAGDDRAGHRLVRVPLRQGTAHRGTLLLAAPSRHGAHPLPPGSPLGRALSTQVASLLAAADLTAELARTRDHIERAASDERARLRRDLHDGLGPELSGISLGVEAARSLLDVDPARAGALLTRLRVGTQQAVEEIRRLVDGLRPADLDLLGLPDALRRHAQALGERAAGPWQVQVTAPTSLDHVPPAVETAAYRIALEALTNASRHAAADTVGVEVTDADGAIELTVRDNGHGLRASGPAGCEGATETGEAHTAPGAHGLGLPSMRHRVEVLGGTLSVTSAPGRGTVVQARLAYRPPAPRGAPPPAASPTGPATVSHGHRSPA
jgi:signal transduction histidine kinase/GAF domain-containing protein